MTFTRMETGKITKVTPYKDGRGYEILIGSTGFFFDSKYGVVPMVGDDITVYTKNFSTIRGVDINGKRIFYKSDEDLERDHREFCDRLDKEKKERFEKNKEKMDEQYENLPDCFKKRIDRFRKNNPNFRVDFEDYELFCCEQAIVIANTLKEPLKITEFKELGYEEQRKMVPDLSEDHSGNTFGMAVYLAYWYLQQPEAITMIAGALSPLVGSVEYEKKNERVSFDKI